MTVGTPPTPPASRWEFVHFVLDSVGRIGIVFTALFTLNSFTGRYHFWGEICSHFVNLYALGALAGIALMAPRKRWRWTLFAAIVLLANALRIAPLYVPDAHAGASERTQKIRLASINVLTENPHRDKVIALVKQEQPDLIFVQEVTTDWVAHLRQALPDYPHYVGEPRDDNFGICVMSRHPLQNPIIRYFGEKGVPAVSGAIDVNGAKLFFVNLHTLPPGSPRALRLRNRQMNEAADLVVAHDGPGIVAGDFNSSAWSPHFRDMVRRTGLRDARRGAGVLGTWPVIYRPFMIPIDQCLVSAELSVTRFETGPETGSDHLPLLIDLAVPIAPESI